VPIMRNFYKLVVLTVTQKLSILKINKIEHEMFAKILGKVIS